MKNVIVVICRKLLRQRLEIILLLALITAHVFMPLLFGIHWKYHPIVLKPVSLLYPLSGRQDYYLVNCQAPNCTLRYALGS